MQDLKDKRRIRRPAILDVTSLEAMLFDEVDACYLKADIFYGRVFERPDVAFDIDGSNAGQYRGRQETHRLRFNRKLLHQEGVKFIDETVAHEVAHHLAYVLHGPRVGHGPEWRQIMVEVFHRPPDRCHDYDVSFTIRDAYIYACNCRKEIPFSKVRHTKVLRGASYTCRQCHGKLRFLHRRDPKSAQVPRVLAVPCLFVAVDDTWRDAKLFEARMSAVLRGEKPGQIITFNDPNTHPLLVGWSIRQRFRLTGPEPAERLLNADNRRSRATHAIGFTASTTSDVSMQIKALANAGVKTRLLRI